MCGVEHFLHLLNRGVGWPQGVHSQYINATYARAIWVSFSSFFLYFWVTFSRFLFFWVTFFKFLLFWVTFFQVYIFFLLFSIVLPLILMILTIAHKSMMNCMVVRFSVARFARNQIIYNENLFSSLRSHLWFK